MKRITLDEIQKKTKLVDYPDLCQWIFNAIEDGRLKPVKASPLNGKTPALHCVYWLAEEEKDYSGLKEELLYSLHPLISNDYYMNHLEKYQQDRKLVLQLSSFLTDRREKLNQPESINERSFEIWGREKFLKRGGGMQLLKHCGISPDFLNFYETTEPMVYYCHNRKVPQNLLILENKDTFYSMRKHLLEGNDRILGESIGTLIYGAGKGIFKSIQDFQICAEPYMVKPENRILYFGDLDYEGIGIFENLAEQFEAEIQPFCAAYIAMLKKAADSEQENSMDFLPETSERQNQNISQVFFGYFPESWTERMKEILEAGRYIPQEILNLQDFGEERGQEKDAV